MDFFDDTFYVTEEYLDFHFYDDSSDSELSNGADNLCALHESVAGDKVKIERINFSFYYSVKNSSHGIRVKVRWNRGGCDKSNIDGFFMLHGDYEFVATKNSKFVSEDCIDEARQFLKKYRIFFALVWGNNFNGKYFDNYLKGKIGIFEDLFDGFYVDYKTKQQLREGFEYLKAKPIYRELEENYRNLRIFTNIVRNSKLFKLYETASSK